jgi:hypothetical protein
MTKFDYVYPKLQIVTVGHEIPVEEDTKTLLATGAKIRAINTRDATLEDAFLRLTSTQGAALGPIRGG